MPTRIVTATEFKAKCLSLLTEMEQFGEPITITRRGRAVAVLSPPRKRARKSSMDSWAGKIKIVGDIVNFETTDMWEALKQD